jgi:hypothetical protein
VRISVNVGLCHIAANPLYVPDYATKYPNATSCEEQEEGALERQGYRVGPGKSTNDGLRWDWLIQEYFLDDLMMESGTRRYDQHVVHGDGGNHRISLFTFTGTSKSEERAMLFVLRRLF